jgi:hypothetical protein
MYAGGVIYVRLDIYAGTGSNAVPQARRRPGACPQARHLCAKTTSMAETVIYEPPEPSWRGAPAGRLEPCGGRDVINAIYVIYEEKIPWSRAPAVALRGSTAKSVRAPQGDGERSVRAQMSSANPPASPAASAPGRARPR